MAPSVLLQDPQWWWWPTGLLDGYGVGVATVLFTVLLEAISLPTVKAIRRTVDGRQLYARAVRANVVNNLLIGPPTYCAGVTLLGAAERLPVAAGLRLGMLMTVGHAVGYYFAHRAMHTRLLFWTHRFHHSFNELVSPVAANAVSPWEYGGAYMLPFFILTPVVRPDALAAVFAGCAVSFANLLIHTPALAAISEMLPDAACSTAGHLQHHKQYLRRADIPQIAATSRLRRGYFNETGARIRYTTHYGASTVSLDAFLKWSPRLERAIDGVFARILGPPLLARRTS